MARGTPTANGRRMNNADVEMFRNEPVRSVAEPGVGQAYATELATLRRAGPRLVAPIVGGRVRRGSGSARSTDPARPSDVVATVATADAALANEAVTAGERAFSTWRWTTPDERAAVLFDAAKLLRERRFWYDAMLTIEVGKNFAEAEGELAEAIDFLEYYGREALRYARPAPLVAVPNETSAFVYEPLGVGIAIPPWNFPLAIAIGTVAAGLVTGNAMILKPSSESPAIAAAFTELLYEAGLPQDVLGFVPGPGKSVGDALVGHAATRFVSFTGSKEVGLGINELAARISPDQRWIKRIVAEMGGKDPIVVSADADLDSAAAGIVGSAFGYSGQKCSACSRAIVEDGIYDELLERIVERTERLSVGDPSDPGTDVGPMISVGARDRAAGFVSRSVAAGGRLVAGGGIPAGAQGHLLEPTVVADVSPQDELAREEVFGPALALIRARTFDAALAIANDSPYGLTGSVFARDPRLLERAARELHVGNLYLNRGCTGALVGAHPFGGFGMSGTDSKAGGPDYLGLFMQGKSVATRVTIEAG